MSHPLLLTSIKACGASPPPKTSFFASCILQCSFLVLMEQIFRGIVYQCKSVHELMEIPTNRHIIARHLGVDAFSCFICAYLGWKSRHLMLNVYKAFWLKDPKAMSAETAPQRLCPYQPGAYFLSLWFFSYQVKNLYDTIVWNDGPEYVMHHVLSMTVCYGALYPGYATPFAIFFFGISEVSTAVLCILANFDEQHGVIGLGEAFPITKVVIGVVFCTLFITCRVILWPICTYYFYKDAMVHRKMTTPEAIERRPWVYIFVGCNVVLSILQVSWLVLLYLIAVKEFKAIGLI